MSSELSSSIISISCGASFVPYLEALYLSMELRRTLLFDPEVLFYLTIELKSPLIIDPEIFEVYFTYASFCYDYSLSEIS